MKKTVIVVAVAALAAVGYYAVNQNGKDQRPAQGIASTSSAVSAPSAPIQPAPAIAPDVASSETSSVVPAWMKSIASKVTPSKPDALPAAKPGLPEPLSPEKQAAMEKAVARLQHLQQIKSTDIREIADAIKQVELANGSPVMQGVRLDVLRKNLEIADRMSSLNNEIIALRPADKSAPSPQAAAAVQAKVQELGELQKQLRTDVSANGTASEK